MTIQVKDLSEPPVQAEWSVGKDLNTGSYIVGLSFAN